MRQSLQLTNSVILERQFEMTVQSKRKQTTRNVIGWLITEQFKKAQKIRYPAKTCETRKYTWVWTKIFSNGWHQPFSRLNLWIEKFTQLKKHISYRKSRGKPGRMAERSRAPDSRNSSVENSGTRVCAWVRIPLLSANVLNNMRQSLRLTNSVILERQFKMTVQSKRKQTTRNVIGWLIAEQFKSAQKRGYPAETCKTRLYARA